MNIESVKTLFQLFSGEADIDKYLPLIELSVSETEKMLLSGADGSDSRLDFLTAAAANLRCQQLIAAQNHSESTYAGKLLSADSGCAGTVKYAEKLLSDYISICSDLIKPKSFVFMSFGSQEEVAAENA